MLKAAVRLHHHQRLARVCVCIQRASGTSSLHSSLPRAQIIKASGASRKTQAIQSFNPLPDVKKSSFSTSTPPPPLSSSSGSLSLYSRMAGIIVFGAVSVFLFYLGGWQVQRSKWKKQMIEQRQAQLAQPIVPAQAVLEHRISFLSARETTRAPEL